MWFTFSVRASIPTGQHSGLSRMRMLLLIPSAVDRAAITCAHLLVLLLAQGGPDDGQQQHPQAVRQAVIGVRHLAQRLQQVLHLVLPCTRAGDAFLASCTTY